MHPEDFFKFLEKFYHLPTIRHRETVEDDFIRKISRKKFFVVVALLDKEDKVFVLRDFNKGYGWELLGGSIPQNVPIMSVSGLANKIVSEIVDTSVFDVKPLARIENAFINNGSKILHSGIALRARFIERVRPKRDIEWGFFQSFPFKMLTSNKSIIRLVKKTSREYPVPFGEVFASKDISFKRLVHKNIVNPLFNYFSTSKIRKKIFNEIGNAKDFLDISSGDDDISLAIQNKFKLNLVVCNDISISSLTHLEKNSLNRLKKEKEGILFTNQSVFDFPSYHKFDVVLFKNTLHHMRNRKEAVSAMKKLKSVGGKIIVIDIENPLKSNKLALFWHKYYVKFLKDRGNKFYTKEQFKALICSVFKSSACNFSEIKTVKGIYLMAVISQNNK